MQLGVSLLKMQGIKTLNLIVETKLSYNPEVIKKFSKKFDEFKELKQLTIDFGYL